MPGRWHTDMEALFPESMKEIGFMTYQQVDKRHKLDERRCDVLLSKNRTLEIQHSHITWNDVRQRKVYWDSVLNKRIIWLIDGNTTDILVEELSDQTYLMKFEHDWKYKSFYGLYDFILMDCNNRIFKINVNKVKCNMIQLKEWKSIHEVVRVLQSQPKHIWALWQDCNSVNARLTIHQKGAGNGKTFGIWKSICENTDKNTFIILTKQHSAKDVIRDELLSQQTNNIFHIENMTAYDYIKKGKHHVIKYTHKVSQKVCVVIIGTIDSYIYNVVKPTESIATNMFTNMLKNIINMEKGNKINDNGTISFGGETVKLNRTTEIWIDEAQDLHVTYLYAFTKIMLQTGMSVQIVGDLLQSLSEESNIFTELNTQRALPNIDITLVEPVNHNRRIQVKQLCDQINRVIRFDKYGMKKIFVEENELDDTSLHGPPMEVIQQPRFFANDTDETKIKAFIDKLFLILDEEVDRNTYVPEDFMFIFPIMKGNVLAHELEIMLNEYWTNKFTNIDYKNAVAHKSSYWRDYDHEKYTPYAYLHKSEEGTVIKLEDSVHATRLVTIQTSKGDGRNVTFVLNCTEDTLKVMCDQEINLKYESYLHVALTRAKRKIYFGLTMNDDDVCERFDSFVDEKVFIIPPPKITKLISLNKLFLHDYTRLYEVCQTLSIKITTNNTHNESGNENVDWKYFCIRKSLMYNVILFRILQHIKDTSIQKQEIFVILKKMSKLDTKQCCAKEYFEILRKCKPLDALPYFPVCTRGTRAIYKRYSKQLYDEVRLVLKNCEKPKEIASNIDENLLRMFLLEYMIKTFKCKMKNEITPSNVYDIVHYIELDKLCKEYKLLSSVQPFSDLTNTCLKYIYSVSRSNIKWNVEKALEFNGVTDDFSFHTTTSFVGYDDENIYHIYTKPEINTLNTHECTVEIIMECLLLMNCRQTDARYTNKTVYTFVLALNTQKYHMFTWNFRDDFKMMLLREVQPICLHIYKKHHEKLFKFCQHVKTLKGKFGKGTSFSTPYMYILNQLTNDINNKLLPPYIKRFLENLHDDYRSDFTKNIMSDRDSFCKHLNTMFLSSFDNYIGNSENNDNEDSFF